ncbi:MAG: homoserine kinase [Rhodospirillaceae bacterium]|nr:homoserine kinase [Rhodospirillaceae bacterium]
MAVYTEVSDGDLAEFVKLYGIGEVLSCKGIAEGVENSNFLLSTDKGSFILTLYEKRVNPGDLPFFLGLMEHLADRGVKCPMPVHALDGEALKTLSGRPAAIITFLSGLWPRSIQAFHCAELGTALAEMHVAGSDFKIERKNSLSVNNWRALLDSCNGRGEEIMPGITKVLETELTFLEKNWPTNIPAGVIHADLFPDNVFFQAEKLTGLIDYYFACNDFFAYDVAICLNAWCFETDLSFNITKAKRMLSSYRKVRDFSAEELAALPLLARGSALRFLLTRLYDWLNTPSGAMVTPKDPKEYLARLRFHQSVKGPGAYGLE